MASEDEDEVVDEITPMHKHMKQNLEPKRNRCAVDGIEIERMNKLIEECKRKEKKECEKCKELTLEVANFKCEQVLTQYNAEEMLMKMQCGEMLCFLASQEAKRARKKIVRSNNLQQRS